MAKRSRKPKTETASKESIVPAFLVLVLLIGAAVGIGYLGKDWLFLLLTTYSKDFGIFVIYVGFVVISLIVAIVMFGILKSTGVFKKTGKENQYQFGGAMAGFLATLTFLISSYSFYNPPSTAIEISGNVRLMDKGAMVTVVEDANIAIAGRSGVGVKTDEDGNFRFELPNSKNLQELELLVTYKGKTFPNIVKRSEAQNAVVEIDVSQLPEDVQEEETTPSESVHQESTEPMSPNVNTESGDVNITYGN